MIAIVSSSRMEPARIEDPSSVIRQKAAIVREAAVKLEELADAEVREALPYALAASSAWNSSRLEGRECDPEDLCRAIAAGSSQDALVCEVSGLAEMHAGIDRAARAKRLEDPSGASALCQIHARLCSVADGLAGSDRPGRFRDVDVAVGRHVPPPHDRIDAFVDHFHARFRVDRLKGQAAPVLALATSHHRLAWIHPFQDGNGRIARLHGHAFAHMVGIAADGLWSLPRALARGSKGGLGYHEMMAVADRPRQGDRDGRGNLSLAALEAFADWFLDAVIEEMTSTRELIARLDHRARTLARDPANWPDTLAELFFA